MNRKGASRQSAALKAILKTLLPEYYLMQSGGLPKDNFLESLEKDEPIVMAITNELTESEIEGTFGRPKRATEGREKELRATPVTPFLNAEQIGKLREQLANMDRIDAPSEEGIPGPPSWRIPTSAARARERAWPQRRTLGRASGGIRSAYGSG